MKTTTIPYKKLSDAVITEIAIHTLDCKDGMECHVYKLWGKAVERLEVLGGK